MRRGEHKRVKGRELRGANKCGGGAYRRDHPSGATAFPCPSPPTAHRSGQKKEGGRGGGVILRGG